MTPIKIAGLVCKYKVAMFRPKTGDWMIDEEKEERDEINLLSSGDCYFQIISH